MNIIELKAKMQKLQAFSPSQIGLVMSPCSPKTLSAWVKQKYLYKLRNGLYSFHKDDLEESNLFSLANTIYGHSYVSMESALAFYGVIPEEVYIVTSCTTLKRNHFSNKLGLFDYRHIKPDVFCGYHIHHKQSNFFKIAEKEKAILDYLYLNASVNSQQDFKAMRWNKAILKTLNEQKMTMYLRVFGSTALKKRFFELKKYYD